MLVPALYAALLLCWFLVLAQNTFSMLTSNEFYQRTHSYPMSFQDFMNFYMAGQIILSPERSSIFDPAVQGEFFNRLTFPAHTDRPLAHLHYPPYTLCACALYALMPLNMSYAVWFLSSILLGSAALILLLRKVGYLSPMQIACFVLGVNASLFAWRCHYIGQTSWFLLAAVAFETAFLVSKNFGTAGIFFALSTFKPQYAPFLLAPSALYGGKKLLVFFFATLAVLLGASAAAIGVSTIINYPATILSKESSTDPGLFPQLMVNLRGVISHFAPQSIAAPIAIVVSLAVAALLFYYWIRWRKGTGESVRWFLAITVMAGVVFAAHVHLYDCLLIAVPAALTLRTLDPLETARIKSVPLKIWCFTLIFYPVISWLLSVADTLFFNLINSMLLACGILHIMRDNTGEAGSGGNSRVPGQ